MNPEGLNFQFIRISIDTSNIGGGEAAAITHDPKNRGIDDVGTHTGVGGTDTILHGQFPLKVQV